MDLGGRKGSATAAGLIDSAGYIGGTFSGVVVGLLADVAGWSIVFVAMAALAAMVMGIALRYSNVQKRRAIWRSIPQPGLS
jgi:MFS transporter, OPA family, glycerol-3-phosphate transporter